MPSSGPNNGGTFASDAGIPGIAWVNPSNAQTSDNSRATSELSFVEGSSHYLKATNFGFAIPAGADIDGIVVEVERKADTNTASRYINDYEVKLVVGGVIQGQNRADT